MINANDKVFDLKELLDKVEYGGYGKFTDFAKDVISNTSEGRIIDIMMPMLAYNILIHNDLTKFNSPIFRIEIDNIEDFLKLAKDGNGSFINIGNMGLFCVYNDFDIFPLARVYTCQASDINIFTKTIEQARASNVIFNQLDLDSLTDEKNADRRVKQHLSDLDNRLQKIRRFVQGKIDSTAVTGGIAIARKDNICSNCAKEVADQLESITATNFNKGVQISMEVCSSCLSSSAENNIILKSIFTNMELEAVLDERQLSVLELREISNNVVERYLRATIKTFASNKEDTITAVTEDGFTLKLRLSALNNYGYMILSPEGKELVRFDSAPDHPEKTEFMPHHVHNDVQEEELIKKKAKKLSKKKSKELRKEIDITDSFLSGVLGLDYVSINNHLRRLVGNI